MLSYRQSILDTAVLYYLLVVAIEPSILYGTAINVLYALVLYTGIENILMCM